MSAATVRPAMTAADVLSVWRCTRTRVYQLFTRSPTQSPLRTGRRGSGCRRTRSRSGSARRADECRFFFEEAVMSAKQDRRCRRRSGVSPGDGGAAHGEG